MAKKTKRQTQLEAVKGELEGRLALLKEMAGVAMEEPYLTDAQAFLSQAIRFVEKQIVTEFGPELPDAKPTAAKKGK